MLGYSWPVAVVPEFLCRNEIYLLLNFIQFIIFCKLNSIHPDSVYLRACRNQCFSLPFLLRFLYKVPFSCIAFSEPTIAVTINKPS